MPTSTSNDPGSEPHHFASWMPDDKYLAAIGAVAIQWAFYELHVDHILRTYIMLVHEKGKRRDVTQSSALQAPFKARARLYLELLDDLNLTAKERQDMRRVINRGLKLRIERNIYVHGYWEAGDRPGRVRVTYHSEVGNKTEKHLVSANDIYRTASRISWLITDSFAATGHPDWVERAKVPRPKWI